MTVDRLPPAAALATATRLLDAAIAGRAAAAALVYDRPTLVVGSAQRAETVVAAACEDAGVVVLRRGSGGGAVLCDPDLLEVDLAVPAGDPRAVGDVTESYRWLGEAWVRALGLLGVETRTVPVAEVRAIDERRRAAARVACYAGLSPYEVVAADGRKLVGLCQRRRRGAVLFQCSVAVAGAPARVAGLLAATDGLAAALAATASLGDLGLRVTVDEVATVLLPLLGPVDDG